MEITLLEVLVGLNAILLVVITWLQFIKDIGKRSTGGSPA